MGGATFRPNGKLPPYDRPQDQRPRSLAGVRHYVRVRRGDRAPGERFGRPYRSSAARASAPDSTYYLLAEKIARLLSDAGFSVVSGGGPGIMEAANKGAFEGKSMSIGLNIQLPHEQKSNHYQDISQSFRHFFARKYMFVKVARRLRGDARRLRHARRTARSADPDPDRQDGAHSADPGRQRLLGRPAQLVPRPAGSGKNDQAEDMDLLQVIDEPEPVVAAIFDHYESAASAPLPEEHELLLNL
jgi:hypothetical protein